jgi:hypothetical protein
MGIRFEQTLGGVLELSALALTCLALNSCAPGYVKASELEQRDQGPSACAKSCSDLGMRMVAMVLVGDTLPGCVCQVLPIQGASPAAAPAPANASAPADAPTSAVGSEGSTEGAAASTAGYVVIAAAAAAREQQQQQERQRQQQQQQQAQK